MSTLAHVFEDAGIATIVLASMADVAKKVGTPRVLACEFPLGRPLGKPGDAAFQHQVLQQAFNLLEADEPIFEHFPEVVESDEMPLACSLPGPHELPLFPGCASQLRCLDMGWNLCSSAS